MDNGYVAIVPLRDSQPHYSGHVCPCRPEMEFSVDGVLETHNAFDGREQKTQPPKPN